MQGDVPAARAVRRSAFARDTCNRSVETRERVHVLNREVGTKRNSCAVVDNTPESIETLDALRTLDTRTLAAQEKPKQD